MMLLTRFVVDKTYPSLNQYYAGKHWGARKKDKDTWTEFFLRQFSIAGLDEISEYEITLEVNNRKDIDNNIPIIKFFNDSLKKGGFIQDDSTKYWKDLHITFNPTLQKNTCIINLYHKLVL